MNAAKMTLVSTVVAAVFGLALGLMSTPAQAHHTPIHTKGGPGGDGGGETPTIVTTEAQWTGGIAELAARPCVAALVKTNGDYGNYMCELVNSVRYDLSEIDRVQTARKGDLNLCDVFDGIDLTPNIRYQYNWLGNCGTGPCTIEIINWFDGVEVITATGEKADRIKLVAFGEATGPFSDPNPFVDSLALDVDEITTLFLANGSGKTLAVCEYSPAPNVVIFQSEPTS